MCQQIKQCSWEIGSAWLVQRRNCGRGRTRLSGGRTRLLLAANPGQLAKNPATCNSAMQKFLPCATQPCNMQLATCNPAMQYHACYVTKPLSVRVWTLVGEKILPWHVAFIFTASYFQYLRIDCLGRMSHVEMLIFRITSPRVILSVLKGHILYFLFIEEDWMMFWNSWRRKQGKRTTCSV